MIIHSSLFRNREKKEAQQVLASSIPESEYESESVKSFVTHLFVLVVLINLHSSKSV